MKPLALLLSILLLAACSTPRTPPQETHYLLTAARARAPVATSNGLTLRVMPLRAPAPFDDSHFVYRETAQRFVIDPYRGFLTPPDRQITQRLREWLAASGLYGHVVDNTADSPVAQRLEGELLELTVDRRDSPVVLLRLRLRLVDLRASEPAIVFDQIFSASRPVSPLTADAIAAAADQALAAMLDEIESTIAQGSR
ncbi:ABC-type transport auxiliary lipoprotein family protein [Andreprevotia chitinilytica]|uniref:ABC-type transport auxiliary lipoprotein family protein n=1 Tax=Andreprevotia chitinilytica TaxID=396808 RepID=UPI00054F1CBE|nr:ABC-type transport auxiliary lipoprotein family protein [Andreprevotia chitinilytica]